MTVADLINAFVMSGATMDTEVLMQAGSDPDANLVIANVDVRDTLVWVIDDEDGARRRRSRRPRVILSWDKDRYES